MLSRFDWSRDLILGVPIRVTISGGVPLPNRCQVGGLETSNDGLDEQESIHTVDEVRLEGLHVEHVVPCRLSVQLGGSGRNSSSLRDVVRLL